MSPCTSWQNTPVSKKVEEKAKPDHEDEADGDGDLDNNDEETNEAQEKDACKQADPAKIFASKIRLGPCY